MPGNVSLVQCVDIEQQPVQQRQDVHPPPVAVVQAMRSACAREAVIGKPILQQIEIPESLDDDGHIFESTRWCSTT